MVDGPSSPEGVGVGNAPESVTTDDPAAAESAPPAGDSGINPNDENIYNLTPEAESRKRTERRGLELGITARSILLTEAKRKLAGPDGTIKDPTTEIEEALKVYHQLGNKKIGGLDFGTDGNPLVLPAIIGSDLDGNPVHFDNQQKSVRRIVETNPDGSFVCEFTDKAGRTVTKTVKNPTTGGEGEVPVQVVIQREVVLDAQFLSQRKLYEGSVEGDQKTVLTAYADTLPQSETDFNPGVDLDPIIEKVAQDTGPMTVNQVRESAFFGQLPPEQQARLETQLKNKTILTAEDMRTLMSFTGTDRLGVRREVKALLTTIKDLQGRTDEVGIRELEETKTRLTMLEELDKQWGEAEAIGGTPYDAKLQEMQDGILSTTETEAIKNALLNGDVESLMNAAPIFKNMTETQRNMWLEYGKKGGKFGGGLLLAILIGLAAIPAGAIYVAAQGAAQKR